MLRIGKLRPGLASRQILPGVLIGVPRDARDPLDFGLRGAEGGVGEVLFVVTFEFLARQLGGALAGADVHERSGDLIAASEAHAGSCRSASIPPVRTHERAWPCQQ